MGKSLIDCLPIASSKGRLAQADFERKALVNLYLAKKGVDTVRHGYSQSGKDRGRRLFYCVLVRI